MQPAGMFSASCMVVAWRGDEGFVSNGSGLLQVPDVQSMPKNWVAIVNIVAIFFSRASCLVSHKRERAYGCGLVWDGGCTDVC